MINPRRAVLFVLTAGLALSAHAAPPQPSPSPQQSPLTAEQVVGHLERTIEWFRRVQAIDQEGDLSGDLALRDRLQQTSIAALRLSFDFARAAATLAKAPGIAVTTTSTGSGQPDHNLDQVLSGLDQRIAALQSKLADIDAQLPRAAPKAKDGLTAERAEVAAGLTLAKEVQSTVSNLARFRATTDASAQGGLAAQIDQLERTVPEARHTAQSSSPSGANRAGTTQAATSSGTASVATPFQATTPLPPPAPAAAPSFGAASSSAPFRPESAGLIGLAGEVLTLRSDRQQVDDAIGDTDEMLKHTDQIRTALTGGAEEFLRRTDLITAPPSDPAQAAQTRRDLENATAQFRRVATALVPLGEQGIAADGTRGALSEWRTGLGRRFRAAWRNLILRASALVIAIAVLLVVSEVWRRATFKYLRDSRRRHQFLLLRRVVVGCAIALVVVVAFLSEIGSLATYAGFVTAGIAVAMQNVILAVVAYFFLIGRKGVRVGDRITLAGVTGQVIDIGLVRIYLMELAGADLHPTGRIVVLSNAVLFQPAALYKQVPGADYLWHGITLTLAPDTDIATAESRLKSAAESVYEGYRPTIEAQHATMQQFVDVETSVARPDVRSRFSEGGVEIAVRYPVDAANAADIDRRMVNAIRQAAQSDPPLKLLSSTGPVVQQVT